MFGKSQSIKQFIIRLEHVMNMKGSAKYVCGLFTIISIIPKIQSNNG